MPRVISGASYRGTVSADRPRARRCGAAIATRHPWQRQKPSASPWPRLGCAHSASFGASLQVAAGPQGPFRRPQQEQERRKSVELSGTGVVLVMLSRLCLSKLAATFAHLFMCHCSECLVQDN